MPMPMVRSLCSLAQSPLSTASLKASTAVREKRVAAKATGDSLIQHQKLTRRRVFLTAPVIGKVCPLGQAREDDNAKTIKMRPVTLLVMAGRAAGHYTREIAVWFVNACG